MTRPGRSGPALLAAALLAVVMVTGGCGKPASPATPSAATPAAAIAVTTAPAVMRDISRTLDVTGSLAALRDVTVGAKAAGRIAQVNLHEGDPVRAGQVVAVMDTSDLTAGVRQARANIEAATSKEQQARAGLTQAVNALQNARTSVKLADRQTASTVTTAEAGLQSAQAALAVVKQGARAQERQQAEEAVRSAKANLDKARSDQRRFRELYREQAVSQAQLDQADAAAEAAQATYNSAQQAHSLIKEGARPEDVRRAELAVQQAREQLERARADRSQVELRREDVQTAEAGVSVARANIRAAEAGVAQARAALQIAEDALQNAYIKSPISGYVATRIAEPGQQLGGGGAVMRVVDPASVYFEAELSESQYPGVHLGQPATIRVDALPNTVLTGKVTRILPVVSAGARNFSVRIDIPDNPRLRPGMFARGTILIDTHRATTLVPKDAVVFDPATGQAHIFVAEDGVAHRRTVQIGYTDPTHVEVLSGARPGEKVIVTGQSTLQEGDHVAVQ
ncbi:MAG: efflux RND transporter periplasmic adaptor subunit [Chthonomonadales bacterium]|nr:efflux RND transporter periplasmic adaptor subunit [Chthonomonadales bacterium]